MRDTEGVSLSGKTWTPLPPAWRTLACSMAGTVLLESSLPSDAEHRSFLFTEPRQMLIASTPDHLPSLFEQIEGALRQDLWVAGGMTYEAGTHFLERPAYTTSSPVAIFGVYAPPQSFDHTAPGETPALAISAPQQLDLALMPHLRVEDYTRAIHQIHRWIAAGDTYQVNYTMRLQSPCNHNAAEVYQALHAQQPSSYAAVLNLLPGETVLSFSPELFFRAEADGILTTKPMKGTSPRGQTPDEDELLATALRNDEKNRAEHVMIVDLLRNDLNRICRMGSVRAERLFDIERLATVHQMTSTIQGQLPAETTWYEVFRALFPGGSITGAPKRHTTDLIARIEAEPRGIYTGAIGYFAPDRTATFNIAIRTAVLQPGRITFGCGGGIVTDSTPAAEYAEALLKSSFVQRASRPLQLIETMRRAGSAIPLLEDHLRRLSQSATELGFACNLEAVHEALRALPGADVPQRLRLLLSRNGEIDLRAAEAPAWPKKLRLRLSAIHTQSGAAHLAHKSTFRPEYSPEHQAAFDAGFTDALFCNADGELTETGIANLLVFIDGSWNTPYLRSGVLPGIYRARLLAARQIQERTLTLDDLQRATHVALCNAVRGAAAVASLQLLSSEDIDWPPSATLPTLPAW